MSSVSLPLFLPDSGHQRFSCQGCGRCCRDLSVQLRDDDVQRLAQQDWGNRLDGPATVTFRGVTFLRKTEAGACVFLDEATNRCRIHAEFGAAAKPLACRLYPFTPVPFEQQVAGTLNFACPTVRASTGGELKPQLKELGPMLRSMPDVVPTGHVPRLTRSLRAHDHEAEALVDSVDHWMKNDTHPLDVRLDGLAWVVESPEPASLSICDCADWRSRSSNVTTGPARRRARHRD